MERRTSEMLERGCPVPPVVGGESGMDWLRSHVVRFSDGAVHAHRRAITVAVIETIQDAPFAGSPTRSLLKALGLPDELESDVATVAGAYQPHADQTTGADLAADRLVDACGGRTEAAAARACVLVQAHAATLALVEAMRSGSDAPPVPFTRRIAADGLEVEVDLSDAPFGRGPHRCPGESLGRRLARESMG